MITFCSPFPHCAVRAQIHQIDLTENSLFFYSVAVTANFPYIFQCSMGYMMPQLFLPANMKFHHVSETSLCIRSKVPQNLPQKILRRKSKNCLKLSLCLRIPMTLLLSLFILTSMMNIHWWEDNRWKMQKLENPDILSKL